MRSLFMIDGVGVPRKTAVRAIMLSLGISYSQAGSFLDLRGAVQCLSGLVVKHVIRQEEY